MKELDDRKRMLLKGLQMADDRFLHNECIFLMHGHLADPKYM